jgi:hypothetical protein
MTAGERLVHLVPPKTNFYDQHERRSYLRAVEIAKRLVDDPSAIASGAKYLARFVRDDVRQQRAYREWASLLQAPVEDIARALLEDSEHGARLRDTAPVFFVISRDQLQRIWARRP